MGLRGNAARVAVVFGFLVAANGCEVREQLEERYRDVSSHEAYARSLRQAGLEDNVVVQRWTAAADAALARPLHVSSPFQEEGLIDGEDPRALGFRVEARRGQRVVVELDFRGLQPGRVFVDVYRQASDSAATPYHELGAGPDQTELEYVVPRSGVFIVRVQPELLHGGEYRVGIRVLPTLAFPVEGRGPDNILSRWGASRDGGRRSHRGVDIFAPRGTPALAAANGRITRVDTTAIGGYVVWLREEANRHSIYYAHLDRQLVQEGQRVNAGDTVGLVGNTGNARTTPPHLHFGIYRRREGAVDPFAFIEPQPTAFARQAVADSVVGTWVRATTTANVRDGAYRTARVVDVIDPGTAAEVVGTSGRWVRVRLPDDVEGYALASQVTPAVGVLAAMQPVQDEWPRVAPDADAPRLLGNTAPPEAAVVGHFAGFGLVFATDGRPGWVPLEDQ